MATWWKRVALRDACRCWRPLYKLSTNQRESSNGQKYFFVLLQVSTYLGVEALYSSIKVFYDLSLRARPLFSLDPASGILFSLAGEKAPQAFRSQGSKQTLPIALPTLPTSPRQQAASVVKSAYPRAPLSPISNTSLDWMLSNNEAELLL